MTEVERIAKGLTPLEVERLIEWKGPSGAAYNAVSEDLCEAGLLYGSWAISPLGEQVRAHLLSETPNG